MQMGKELKRINVQNKFRRKTELGEGRSNALCSWQCSLWIDELKAMPWPKPPMGIMHYWNKHLREPSVWNIETMSSISNGWSITNPSLIEHRPPIIHLLQNFCLLTFSPFENIQQSKTPTSYSINVHKTNLTNINYERETQNQRSSQLQVLFSFQKV